MRCVCASWVDGLWLTSDESRAEYVKSWGSYDKWKAVDSRLLLSVVENRICWHCVKLIFECISTHGTP